MHCILCNNSYFDLVSSVVRDSTKHSVFRCKKCDLHQLFPLPLPEEDKKFYDEGNQFKNIGEPTKLNVLSINQRTDTMRRADFVAEHFKKGSSILDVGSGFGFFLEEMKKGGFKPTGIEVSLFARSIARRVTSVQILNTDIFNTHFNKKYDIITLFHVLEHIGNPIEFLKKIRSLLADDGKLLIEVPNRNDQLLKANEAYRKFYWQKAHILYFNDSTLIKVLKKAGYEKYKIIFIHRYGLENLMHWMIYNKPQIKNPSFSVNTNYKWLDTYYKKMLITKGISDTMLAVIS